MQRRSFISSLAVAGGTKEGGHISSACCELANVSLDLGGRPLAYDPATRTVRGDAEATTRLARDYRTDFTHPTPDTV